MNDGQVREYLAHLARRGLSRSTIYYRRRTLARFAACGFSVERFRDTLSPSARVAREDLLRVRLFLRWAGARQEAEAMKIPRHVPALPLPPPSREEVESFLASVEGAAPTDVRDRAMLELMYSSALRGCEVRRLRLGDIDLADGLVRVQGKGGHERVVPVGRIARAWIARYVAEGRPRLSPACDALFVTWRGRAFTIESFQEVMHRRAAGRSITGHALRRAAALHCLAEGMSARELQELLGHADLKNLERYTGLSRMELRRVLERLHPRWALRPRPPTAGGPEDDAAPCGR